MTKRATLRPLACLIGLVVEVLPQAGHVRAPDGCPVPATPMAERPPALRRLPARAAARARRCACDPAGRALSSRDRSALRAVRQPMTRGGQTRRSRDTVKCPVVEKTVPAGSNTPAHAERCAATRSQRLSIDESTARGQRAPRARPHRLAPATPVSHRRGASANCPANRRCNADRRCDPGRRSTSGAASK